MLLPVAPTKSMRRAMPTPSNFTRPSYHGVLVAKDTIPIDSSMARSNWAIPSLLVFAMRPDTVRTILPWGCGNAPANAWLAPLNPATAANPRMLTNERRVDVIDMLFPVVTCGFNRRDGRWRYCADLESASALSAR